MKVKYNLSSFGTVPINNYTDIMRRVFPPDDHLLNLKACFFLKGIQETEEIERQVKDIVAQFLPREADRQAAKNTNITVRMQTGGALMMFGILLPSKYRKTLFKAIDTIQEQQNCEVMQFSFHAVESSLPQQKNYRGYA